MNIEILKNRIGKIPFFKNRKKGNFGSNLEASKLDSEVLTLIKETYKLKSIKVNLTGVGCSVFDEKMQNNRKEENDYTGSAFELFEISYTLDGRLFFRGKML